MEFKLGVRMSLANFGKKMIVLVLTGIFMFVPILEGLNNKVINITDDYSILSVGEPK